MNIYFQIAGNAVLIFHDEGEPKLVTDPWVVGHAYFGSWRFSHEITEEQLESIKKCEFIWISHGHPDHLSLESLRTIGADSKKILLPNHVGGRIARDLTEEGFDVTVLEDRKWYPISDHIKILTIADFNQDAILFADINGRLVFNQNDSSDRSWGYFVKKIIKQYNISFLLALSSQCH
jgi:L-ascorbate metabolism protein UlaG (beta-lactamase superfamily)